MLLCVSLCLIDFERKKTRHFASSLFCLDHPRLMFDDIAAQVLSLMQLALLLGGMVKYASIDDPSFKKAEDVDHDYAYKSAN
jgi:hypothetical protein